MLGDNMLQTTAQNLQDFVEHAILIQNHSVHIADNRKNWKCSFKTDGNRIHPIFVKGDKALWITLRNDKVYSTLLTLATMGVEVSIQVDNRRDEFNENYSRYVLSLPDVIDWRLCQALTSLIEDACQAVESE